MKCRKKQKLSNFNFIPFYSVAPAFDSDLRLLEVMALRLFLVTLIAIYVHLAAGGDSDEDYYYGSNSFDDVLDEVESIFTPSHVMTFVVHPREKFCFYEEITEEELAEAHLQVTKYNF